VSPSKPWFFFSYVTCIFFQIFHISSKKLKNLYEVISYQEWVRSTFILSSASYLKSLRVFRESLWQDAINSLGGQPFHFFEFGVARGHVPSFLSGSHLKNLISYTGFDLFTGLPRAWRDHDIGAFSNHGEIPNFEDSRFQFVVGDVMNTFDREFVRLKSDSLSLFFFDLDLFEPSLHVWNEIKPYLKSGDVVYFDEAFDKDERLLLNQFILIEAQFQLISHTSTGLLLKFKMRK